MPDGHRVYVPVIDTVDKRIEIDELDHRRFTYRYSVLSPSENYRSLSPNIIHATDGYIMREMVRRCYAEGITLLGIHDCFLFYPDDAGRVCQLYREVLADIAKSDLLNDILSQIVGYDIGLIKDSEDLHVEILQSEYALS
jgi:DNA-directed RNA polymerase